MHTRNVLLASILISAATSGAVQLALSRGTPVAAPRPSAAPEDPALRDAASALAAEQERVRAELERLARELETIALAASRSVETELARAEAPAAGETAAPAAAEPASVDELFARLLAVEDDAQWAEVWKEAREAGRTDELIALFESRCDEAPNDPERRYALGLAYLAKIEEVGAGPLAGEWATKADQAFDHALEIDPEHWDARFTKAMALSFWPPVFGKKPAAIQELERLRAQQARLAPEPRFAETYLMLGNLYRELGETEKARAAWSEGLALYPGDLQLAQQVSWSGN